MQSVATFVCCKFVPSVFKIHMITLLVREPFIVLRGLTLPYSCVCYCVVVLCGPIARHSYLCFWINRGTFKWQSQEVDHARPLDDAKLFLHISICIYWLSIYRGSMSPPPPPGLPLKLPVSTTGGWLLNDAQAWYTQVIKCQWFHLWHNCIICESTFHI